MSERRLMPVQAEVVKDVLVDRILTEVLARHPADPIAPVKQALEAPVDLAACDGGRLDRRMRDIGYLTREVEAGMFDPARQPMEGLRELLADRMTGGESWASAAAGVSAELARSEPLPRPAPSDERAVSWKVPGPGGHVRHYAVAAAIAEALRGGSERLPAAISDAGELKRCWTYGFMVRCCEEALPP